MDYVVYALILVGVAVLIAGGIYSMSLMRKQERHEMDKSMGPSAVKHPVSANPILILYIVIPLLAIIGGIVWVVSGSK